MNPLWVAFTILIGGLLLDVLISATLGISAVPINIIIGMLLPVTMWILYYFHGFIYRCLLILKAELVNIGVIVVLGLGTVLRLALAFCHEWSSRRVVQRVETQRVPLGYHPGL